MSRAKLIKQLKKKNPQLNHSELETLIDIFTNSIKQALIRGQECYEEYVRINGTAVEIEQKKKEIASADEFSSIRGLWAGCAACHGQNGEGMGAFPKLAGQSKQYIVERLTTYKNKGQVGAMSSTMWAQAGMLSESDIDTIGKFVEETLK